MCSVTQPRYTDKPAATGGGFRADLTASPAIGFQVRPPPRCRPAGRPPALLLAPPRWGLLPAVLRPRTCTPLPPGSTPRHAAPRAPPHSRPAGPFAPETPQGLPVPGYRCGGGFVSCLPAPPVAGAADGRVLPAGPSRTAPGGDGAKPRVPRCECGDTRHPSEARFHSDPERRRARGAQAVPCPAAATHEAWALRRDSICRCFCCWRLVRAGSGAAGEEEPPPPLARGKSQFILPRRPPVAAGALAAPQAGPATSRMRAAARHRPGAPRPAPELPGGAPPTRRHAGCVTAARQWRRSSRRKGRGGVTGGAARPVIGAAAAAGQR